MLSITTELIERIAPNASAITNAKKISQKNGFVVLSKSEDETLLYGECKGSGKKPYITSADFIDPSAPVFRCNCPSRQFPCKHALALLFDYMAQKTFTSCEIPEDIISKREKIEKKKESTEKSPKTKNINKTALSKKMKKQLEGLELAETFLKEVLQTGIASLSGKGLKIYSDLAKQMGDYYLPAPQALIQQILFTMKELQKNAEQEKQYYKNILQGLVELYNTIKKARVFLKAKIETEQVDMEDSTLYNKIGYIWQISQLEELGLYKQNVELIQLSFDISYNEIKKEYTDIGYWIDLESGVISKKENIRPIKAIKYIKQDDTENDCAQIEKLYYYPGEINKRIKWENTLYRAITEQDCKTIKQKSRTTLAPVIKEVKNQLKNVLSEKSIVYLIAFENISKVGEQYILEDNTGDTIELRNKHENIDILNTLHYLPNNSYLKQQSLVCELMYDDENNKIFAIPHTIITDKQILKLLY
ncbi:SWIM zinc finger family protein [Lachnospiraceae bacterium 46-61]